MVALLHRSRLHILDISPLSYQCRLTIRSPDGLSQLGVMHCLQGRCEGDLFLAAGGTRTGVQREKLSQRYVSVVTLETI